MTLIVQLRSSVGLSTHEASPTINQRLCGVHHVPRRSSIIHLGDGVEVDADDAEAAKQWLVTDIFHPATTTHLISSNPFPRTINLFKAVMSSVPVVDQAWIVESATRGEWLPHEKFLVSLFTQIKGNLDFCYRNPPQSQRQVCSTPTGNQTRTVHVTDEHYR